jgi:hypothetical protein
MKLEYVITWFVWLENQDIPKIQLVERMATAEIHCMFRELQK